MGQHNIDSETSYYERMISEMIHKKQELGLNKQSDTLHFLIYAYYY